MNNQTDNKKVHRVILAWFVHLVTASGAVWGFLALIALFEQDYRKAIGWMIIAMFVDGFDGMLARFANVKKFASKIDGALLDNLVDYLNYVIIPAVMLYKAGLLPQSFSMAGSILIILASAYQFTQMDAKTEDHYFKGFPSYWNILVLYLLVLGLSIWVNLIIVVLLSLLVFVPIKYVYPSRNTRLRRLTLVLTYAYGVVGVWAFMQYPNVPEWLISLSLFYVGFYSALSLWPSKRVEVIV